jgi:hypothetical protein
VPRPHLSQARYRCQQEVPLPSEFPHSADYCRQRAAILCARSWRTKADDLRVLYAKMADQWDDLAGHAERLAWHRCYD